MSATTVFWRNIYQSSADRYPCFGREFDSPQEAQAAPRVQDDEDFVGVAFEIKGHWHRPPVGIKAEQCSHCWEYNNWMNVWYLEERT